ncbi:TetR/AcrR family transcriptional regulator [Novosphingobium sp. YJ-S2-02]|uniref:TetR/AcrR family transcriptional regulator n=1 Tax=Novosphingobium aureum TaxID=2792964 RepID=A0A931MJZ5_9SPHN|nr:TetR/AcrR family transcriptional regulator [Novosphingobium aureum]MBH0112000.1 TetR/AcrR family transcriptional regulator [Novosphingobium aureum]
MMQVLSGRAEIFLLHKAGEVAMEEGMTKATSPEPTVLAGSAGQEADTRVKIMLTAERLFGEYGIDGVSLRKIRLESGQNNNSAVHYHFADRKALVSAILQYRVDQMEPERREMIDCLRRDGQENDLRSLLKIMVIPQINLVDEQGRHPYMRFTSEYLTRFRATGIAHPGDSAKTAPALAELMELFYAAMFTLDRDIALLRLNAATLIFLNLVGSWDAGLRFMGERHSLELVIDEALTMATAALQAPPSASLRARYQKG